MKIWKSIFFIDPQIKSGYCEYHGQSGLWVSITKVSNSEFETLCWVTLILNTWSWYPMWALLNLRFNDCRVLCDIEEGLKELSSCQKLWFFSGSRCCRPLVFQTMNSVTSNNLSLKYLRFIPSICNDIGIREFEFVSKTQFLYP